MYIGIQIYIINYNNKEIQIINYIFIIKLIKLHYKQPISYCVKLSIAFALMYILLQLHRYNSSLQQLFFPAGLHEWS